MNTVRSKRWGHRRLVLQAPAGYLGMKHVLGNAPRGGWWQNSGLKTFYPLFHPALPEKENLPGLKTDLTYWGILIFK